MELLLETVCQTLSKYYTLGTEVSIDEVMICFCSHSWDTFKMSNKLIDEDYKAFCLAYHRYIFEFLYSISFKTNSRSERVDNLSNTSAMVFSLAMSLPYKYKSIYHLYR